VLPPLSTARDGDQAWASSTAATDGADSGEQGYAADGTSLLRWMTTRAWTSAAAATDGADSSEQGRNADGTPSEAVEAYAGVCVDQEFFVLSSTRYAATPHLHLGFWFIRLSFPYCTICFDPLAMVAPESSDEMVMSELMCLPECCA
jgi:hypothetical protein